MEKKSKEQERSYKISGGLKGRIPQSSWGSKKVVGETLKKGKKKTGLETRKGDVRSPRPVNGWFERRSRGKD